MTALDFRLFEDTAWMHEYQAFVLSADRQIISRLKFSSPDDRTARLHAKQCLNKHDVELWERDRWVASFTPVQSLPPRSGCGSELCPSLLDSTDASSGLRQHCGGFRDVRLLAISDEL